MDSPQSVVSPFKGSSVFLEPPEKQKAAELFLSGGIEVQSKVAPRHNLDNTIGVLEVYIHQARDIHNICIYHKQDVYAKICLTSNPEKTVSTQIINGGGKNPVFNEKLRLDVHTIDSSLKCEIWMLSRVRNYLEDQLLGFALVPLSEVVIKKGELEKEFSLSSTDLFHSPAGFVQLSLSYSGTSPDVMALPAATVAERNMVDSAVTEPLPNEFDKIEFPDQKIMTENDLMVSEYFEIQCSSNLESQSSESLVTYSETVANESIELLKPDTPPSSVSTCGESAPASLPASSQSCDTPGLSKSPNEECVSPPKENPRDPRREEVGDAESNASETMAKPIITLVNIEPPEQKVVQQDIVDMYMKSMQQFTESLAKMKLPMDFESGPTSSENSSTSDLKSQTPKSTASRVFYGSRAFF